MRTARHEPPILVLALVLWPRPAPTLLAPRDWMWSRRWAALGKLVLHVRKQGQRLSRREQLVPAGAC